MCSARTRPSEESAQCSSALLCPTREAMVQRKGALADICDLPSQVGGVTAAQACTFGGPRGLLGSALHRPPWRAERAGCGAKGLQRRSEESARTSDGSAGE
eukprot:3701432-Pyramimonas_sp.AAC.1